MAVRIHLIILFGLLCPEVFPHSRAASGMDMENLISASAIEKNHSLHSPGDTLKKTRKWTRELYNIVLVNATRKVTDTITTRQGFGLYEEYRGLVIREIRYLKLDPFGTDLYDTSYFKNTRLNRTGNALHFSTLDRVAERHTLFREGDLIDPDILADNERLLREQSFIEDVRIVVDPVEDNPGMADVILIIRDTWSRAFFVELSDVKSGKVELYDRSVFGTGNEIQANIHWDPEKSDMFGLEATYRSRNIFGTFIDSRISYQNVFETQSITLQLDRKYFTPNTKYAGSFQAQRVRAERPTWVNDSTWEINPLHFDYLDGWIGRAINLSSKAEQHTGRTNLFLATRLYKYHFDVRPDNVSSKTLYEYHNRSLWMNSIHISNQLFFRSNLIYSFGRTEDIPTGWMAGVNFGKEFSEFTDRYFASLTLSGATYLSSMGYVYFSGMTGGFHSPEGELQQGMINMKMNYFTNLFLVGQYKLRYFVAAGYTRGLNRFEPERVDINDKRGLTGFFRNDIYGQQKTVLNLEAVCYTPFEPAGFKTVIFAFTDHAFLGNCNIPLQRLAAYSAYGLGLRLRNERLVFPTIQLRFAYYPGVKGILPIDYFKISGEKRFTPSNFSPGAPGLPDYR